ncbi:squalene synthase HpnC [Micromonospora sp. NPDC049559]|uniref:squalene synthase HpnC n=1 Tax=Micromonospora sp. NPDC049559 TaxID=3155923 RepID=UPI00341E6FAD
MLDLTNAAASQPSRDRAAQRRDPQAVLAGENFPVAVRILPATTRRHLLALYTYARYVDDLGDEPAVAGPGDRLGGPAVAGPGGAPVADGSGTDADAADRLSTLRWFAGEVRDLYDGRPPRHPVLVRLAPTVAACRLPADPLLRLIAANERDQVKSRYADHRELVDYCHLSADPVGELVLHVFGAHSPERVALSDRICTALQIVEHLQDVAEDRRRGRIYLPADELAAHGVAERDLDAPRAGGALREVIRVQAERAAAALDAGAPLVGQLRGWARVAVAGYVAGGRAALTALARSGYDPLPGAPRPARRDVLGHWLKLMWVRAG